MLGARGPPRLGLLACSLVGLGLLLLDGLGVGASPRGAASAAECLGATGSCVQQQEAAGLEEESLMQLSHLGLQAGVGTEALKNGGRSAFVLKSKPFFRSEESPAASGEDDTGALILNEDGTPNTYYLPGAKTLDGGLTVEYKPPYRLYLMKTPETDYSDKDKFYRPSLPGKTLTVDVDLKRDGPSCGCYLTFFLVDMPWAEAGPYGDHYCDAQCLPGWGCCPELDLNEGNKNVQQVATHACTMDGDDREWFCDARGHPQLRTQVADFGPNAESKIDSSRPFTYAVRFDQVGDDLTITTTISQEDREVVLQMGPGDVHVNALLADLQKGLVFVTGYWYSEDMSWMDGEVCGNGPEHCNMHPAYLSNWRLTTNPATTPAPTPAPTPEPTVPAPPRPPFSGPGRCCFGPNHSLGCRIGRHDWCNQSPANCHVCTGDWWPLEDLGDLEEVLEYQGVMPSHA